MKVYEVWNCCPCTNTVRVLPNVKMRQTRAHTRGHVAGTIWRRQAPQRVETVPKPAHTRGHVAGTCCSDSFPRMTSPLLRKKFSCGERIMTYGMARFYCFSLFLLVLTIL